MKSKDVQELEKKLTYKNENAWIATVKSREKKLIN